MASATDPIYVLVTSHTQSPDGTTRNDTFYMTSSLNSYSTQLANNIATPVWNMVKAEWINTGNLARMATPIIGGLAAGGPVELRTEVGVGFQPLATPLRYHLVKHDVLQTATPGSTGQFIYDWINGILLKMTSLNLLPGATYTNG